MASHHWRIIGSLTGIAADLGRAEGLTDVRREGLLERAIGHGDLSRKRPCARAPGADLAREARARPARGVARRRAAGGSI